MTAEYNGTFLIALPYGDRTDWLKNVLAAGSATLVTHGRTYQVSAPEVVPMTEVTAYFIVNLRRPSTPPRWPTPPHPAWSGP